MRYILMNKNTPILECDIDPEQNTIGKIVKPLNLDYLLIIATTKDGMVDKSRLNAWWHDRCIPASRAGLQQALMEMNIPSQEYLLDKGFGLSLSDQYWINPNGELKWQDVNFFDNSFSEDVGNALFGEGSGKDHIDLASPDNTSDGWLKKRWKIIDGERVLIKGGSGAWRQETVNEVMVSLILERLDMMAYTPYSLVVENGEPYSACKNFITPETELVSAWQIWQSAKKPNHLSAYDHLLECCDRLGIIGMQKHLDKMLTLDYLIANTDRHMNNFGVIRDVNTLVFVGIAPIYDSGTSLWHDVDTNRLSGAMDIESKPFKSKHSKQIGLVKSFEGVDLSRLDGIENELRDIMAQSPYIDPRRADSLCKTIVNRVERLEQIKNR